jgi:hypothetical protein
LRPDFRDGPVQSVVLPRVNRPLRLTPDLRGERRVPGRAFRAGARFPN